MADAQDTQATDAQDTNVEVRGFVVGPIHTNCYALVVDGHAIVVDPGASGAAIAKHLDDVTVDMVVATHGHGDHVGGVADLLDALGYKVPFAINERDVQKAKRAAQVGNLGVAYDRNAPDPDVLLKEGDVIEVGGLPLVVIETPGHTEGSICLLGQGICFTGDTLFKNSAGRTDFPGGDAYQLAASLDRLKELVPPETTVLPGHNQATTMADELANNPFLMDTSTNIGRIMS